MKTEFITLFVIALIAAITPLIARYIPRRMLPETVILLLAGSICGPYMAGFIQINETINLLSELGLAFLFLLAGYEIDPKALSSDQGKRGLKTWVASAILAALALVIAAFVNGWELNRIEAIALAIALTTTALGTLIPILKERNLKGTPVGDAIISYGTWGELCPVLAMALLLSTRAEWKTILILLAFIVICVGAAIVPARARKTGHKIYQVLASKRNTTSQSMVRITILLLIGLVTLSEVFELDVVLGSFAAGFILRYVVPEGNEDLELKLDGIAYGFFIPIFFITSGAKIDLAAIADKPVLLVGFICMLLLIRAIPILFSLAKESQPLSVHHRISVALYCTTALPVIVAVSTLAVNAKAMSQETASILVAAGAITVFIMPLLASAAYSIADIKPLDALKEIINRPRDVKDIVEEHIELERMLRFQDERTRAQARKIGHIKGEPSWENAAYQLQKQSKKRQKMLARLDEVKQELAKQDEETAHALARRALKEHNRRLKEVGRADLHAQTNNTDIATK